jgi:hypothetical protein
MGDGEKVYTGGCLCGAVRYEARGEPTMTGHCYCGDCRKASGSGFMPFMRFRPDAVRFSGETVQFRSKSARGTEVARYSCPVCGGLVSGGRIGADVAYTIYAGSLDNPEAFEPKVAVFNRDRPAWALLPPGLTVFATMPGQPS